MTIFVWQNELGDARNLRCYALGRMFNQAEVMVSECLARWFINSRAHASPLDLQSATLTEHTHVHLFYNCVAPKVAHEEVEEGGDENWPDQHARRSGKCVWRVPTNQAIGAVMIAF